MILTGVMPIVTLCPKKFYNIGPISIHFQTAELSPAMASLNLKGCMVIPDDFEGYPKDLFMIPKHYESSVDSVLIPGGVIQVRIADTCAEK
jgi:hypothetical protein